MADILYQINRDGDFIFILIRTIVLFVFSMLIIRYGNRRFQVGSNFDYLVLIILGGVIAKGILGSATLISTLIASITLILLHRCIAMLSAYSYTLEYYIKGNKPYLLVENGQFKSETLRKFHITESDIYAEMRKTLHTNNLEMVETAWLESTGKISFIIRNS